MKYSLFIVSILFLVIACEETEPVIETNPNATASFYECIPLSFKFSQQVGIDTLRVERIQEAIRLARTVDIELQDISPYDNFCPTYNVLEIHLDIELDPAPLIDECQTGVSTLDSLLSYYEFDYCVAAGQVSNPAIGVSYVVHTDRFLNLGVLAEMMLDIPGVIYAGGKLTICNVIQCHHVSLSILADVYTIKFADICSENGTTEWVIVVHDKKATLISKTS